MNKLQLVLGLVSMNACSSDGASPPDSGVNDHRMDASTGGTTGCSAAADRCLGETVCLENRCEAAFPRAYNVTNVHVMVPTTKRDGTSWDALGGAPDLYFQLILNSTTVITTTPSVPDAFSATFAGPFTVQLTAGAQLLFVVGDEDVSSNDPATGCNANPITAGQLRARANSCNDAPNVMTFTISPK